MTKQTPNMSPLPHLWNITVKHIIKTTMNPVSILYKSKAGRYRPVSYPDGPITARYRFIKNASWEETQQMSNGDLKPEHKKTTNRTTMGRI